MPTGEYGATARVDLSPVFGVIENVVKLTIEQPGEDVLDRRLAQLASEDEAVRRTAVADLRYFPDDAAKVVPALLDRLADDSSAVRVAALSALMSFPAGTAEHADRFLAVLRGGEEVSVSERYLAVLVLARTAPLDEETGKALAAAAQAAPEAYRAAYETALRTWTKRVEAAAKPDGAPGR